MSERDNEKENETYLPITSRNHCIFCLLTASAQFHK